MTLFELIVIVGTVELLALAWVLGALAWRRTGLRAPGTRDEASHAAPRRTQARRGMTARPLPAQSPEHRESVPGG